MMQVDEAHCGGGDGATPVFATSRRRGGLLPDEADDACRHTPHGNANTAIGAIKRALLTAGELTPAGTVGLSNVALDNIPYIVPGVTASLID